MVFGELAIRTRRTAGGLLNFAGDGRHVASADRKVQLDQGVCEPAGQARLFETGAVLIGRDIDRGSLHFELGHHALGEVRRTLCRAL